MSVCYEFYAEAKVGNTWHSINPVVTRVNGTTRTVPVLWGNSGLFDLYSLCCDYGFSNYDAPDNTSNEVQRLLCNGHLFTDTVPDRENNNKPTTAREYYCVGESICVVNFDRLVRNKLVPGRRYRNQGYVLRDTTMAMQCREISSDDEVVFLTQEEYEKLDKNEQHNYVWYEWSYPWDTYGQLSDLNERVRYLTSWLADTFYDTDMDDTVSFEEAHNIDTRLIVVASW